MNLFSAESLVTVKGLSEASLNIVQRTGKALLVLTLSVMTALLFWWIRATIPEWTSHSYREYVILIDSLGFGEIPSLWIQTHFRNEWMDAFLRWVWLSYAYVLIFGGTLLYIIRNEIQRYFLACIITLIIGLIIHTFLPTQPPWMAIGEVIRINGERFTQIDKNLTAAMPSIHQAIVCIFTCAFWKYKIYGRVSAVVYNTIMVFALLYLGEHFLVDSLAGIIIGIGSWFIAQRLLPLLTLKATN